MKLSFIIIVIFVCALMIFAERAFPFILFSKTNPPKIIKIIQKFIPTMVIACLLVYCLKDVTFTDKNGLYLKGFIPSFSALFVTLGLQLWRKNTLLSILCGTVIYMVFLRILQVLFAIASSFSNFLTYFITEILFLPKLSVILKSRNFVV